MAQGVRMNAPYVEAAQRQAVAHDPTPPLELSNLARWEKDKDIPLKHSFDHSVWQRMEFIDWCLPVPWGG